MPVSMSPAAVEQSAGRPVRLPLPPCWAHCSGGGTERESGWLRVELVSQLVMRSFDVADKGEPNKGEGPLGRRGERTPDHNRHSKRRGKWKKKEEKREKDEKSVGGGRKQHPDRT
ncbi:hypothetical protein D9C73_012421 [Collichthys lucidus]|uniref:Uncharacterized protein n=1 Tax=Collichthys lucidus TaxID=240159 RepID=A0A4V6AQ11_COLLU|nr:hypothetical protein D9C73_012421 [Collichthys lucidus]